jgi:ribosome biogenesis protein ENP2
VRRLHLFLIFILTDNLCSLGLDHLVGTPALKPYMHGYFMSLKLYDAARVIANPFIYAEHREKVIRQKLEKLAEGRIRSRKDNLPKVNRALAERIMKNIEKDKNKKRKRDEDGDEEMEDVQDEQSESEGEDPVKDKKKKENADKLLMDPRFKAIFEDPAFEIDEMSKEFALLHPSQAEVAARKRKQEGQKTKTKTAVDEEEEERSSGGGISSDDLGMDDTESGDEEKEEELDTNSSEDGKFSAFLEWNWC